MKELHKTILIFLCSLFAGIALSFVIFTLNKNSNTAITKTPQRIISLAPNVTETICELGLKHKLIARSDFCNSPPEILSLPSAGNNVTPNFELMIKLKPDVIFIQGKNESIKSFCNTYGIKLVSVDMDSITSIFKEIELIGTVLDVKTRSLELIKKLKSQINGFIKKNKSANPPKVLVITGRRTDTLTGIFTVGEKSFLSEAIEIAGGINIFKGESINYATVSIESVIKKSPDIIIEISMNNEFSKETKIAMLKQWSMHPTINAVKNNRIYFCTENYILIPGPGIIKTIALFGKIINTAQ